MLSNAAGMFIVASMLASASAQSGVKYMDRAVIQRSGSSTTVTADAPVPLLQALTSVRLEYGWRVNWEQAPGFSRLDVEDATAPDWRSAHPDAKGVTRPSGGIFVSNLPSVSDPANVEAEFLVLAKLLEDYNATENPGKYKLRTDPGGQFTVVGVGVRDDRGALQDVSPVLDSAVTVAREPRNLYDTVVAILEAVHSETGKTVIMMSVPNNEFRDTRLTLGGKRVAARLLLQEALAYTQRPLQYDLSYDPDDPVYILNVSVARHGGDDGRMPAPIDRPR